MERFICEKCAACCRQIGKTFWGKALALPNGVCRHLDENSNLCTIYEHRPLFCNIDAYYELFLKETMDRKFFYKMNKEACQKLQSNLQKPFNERRCTEWQLKK